MIAFFTYNDVSKYFQQNLIAGVILVGFIFFILGWIISRLMRPSTYMIEEEIHNIKKHIISDLNTSKKFNADYQLLAKKEKYKEAKEQEAQKKEVAS
ncbi:MAG: hypothetical protein ACSHX6_03145 [Akkermansiaceae bacterium]